MPEGPEVHYFYHSVVATLKGQSLRDVAILSGRYIKHPIILNFRELLESLPQKVIETGVCGKNIWILLENGMSLYFTHGLTKSICKPDCILLIHLLEVFWNLVKLAQLHERNLSPDVPRLPRPQVEYEQDDHSGPKDNTLGRMHYNYQRKLIKL